MPRSGESSAPALAGRQATPHAAARWCAAQGWPVHPLAPGRKTPAANCARCRLSPHPPRECPCVPAGRPCHGFHGATTDPALVDAWWGSSPSSGVGVATGPARLVVLDIDAHHAQAPDRSRLLPGIAIPEQVNLTGLASGFDTLALLAAYRRRQDPAHDTGTLRVRTPSGGLHVWYRLTDPGTRLRCSTGSSPRVALAWQVDVRADGGYIVAPTTRTAQGTYVAEGDTRLPAPLPRWLHDELVRTGHLVETGTGTGTTTGAAPDTGPPPTPVPTPRRRNSPRRAAGAQRILDPLLAEVAACAAVPEGAAFTEKLNRAAFTAGGLAAAGHLDEQQARALLEETAARARPHQHVRNARIIRDALTAGAARPLDPQGRS
ncbi:bifunctional DNA primase/polymerase [Streptomyces sp. NPDC102406]|uniref:bifunctional DNA primase/polymerase n=1 Tax=Streptomyces sp. NPDC102406 TaxID=3366171 RepID=UPI00380CF085